jgi:molybdopterin/thiamine biosynthesis adenylyltransferase
VSTNAYATRWAAMKRMAASNVLIVGVQGLGVEIGTYFIHHHVYVVNVVRER